MAAYSDITQFTRIQCLLKAGPVVGLVQNHLRTCKVIRARMLEPTLQSSVGQYKVHSDSRVIGRLVGAHGPASGIVTKKASSPTRLPREPRSVKQPRERRDHPHPNRPSRLNTSSSPPRISSLPTHLPHPHPFSYQEIRFDAQCRGVCPR